MEIQIDCWQKNESGQEDLVANALFLFVSRNKQGKAKMIPKFQIQEQDPEFQKLCRERFAEGEKNKLLRK